MQNRVAKVLLEGEVELDFSLRVSIVEQVRYNRAQESKGRFLYG